MSNKLTDDDKKAYLTFVKAVREVQSESQLDRFIVRFQLGTRFTIYTVVGTRVSYCDLTED